MKSSYLVQRGKFKGTTETEIKGIDSLIQFDYMGSAEFEFGALPASLRRIIKNITEYEFSYVDGITDSKGNLMTIFHDKRFVDDVKINAMYLFENKLRLKERCDIQEYAKGINSCYGNNNFWWDIENDFMICFGEKNSNSLKIAIEKLEEKWK